MLGKNAYLQGVDSGSLRGPAAWYPARWTPDQEV